MRVAKLVVSILTAALTSAGAASAADLPARTYSKAPAMVAAVYNWTGFYVGLNVGYGWGTDATVLTTDTDGAPGGPFTALLNQANSVAAKPAGVIGGAQAGYNWQSGRLLAGVEADFSGADIHSSSDFSGPVGVTRFVHRDQKLEWLATLRGRIGYLATEQFLLYATGGLAVGEVTTNSSLTTTVPNNVPACIAANIGICFGTSDRSTRIGWTVGAGAEYAFMSNWSVKAEYVFVSLEHSTSTGLDFRFNPPLQFHADTRNDFHIARVGLNYRFGGPVVAKY
jgi:outer membrane immunogenic protein